jgi:peptide/nickel transport system substrate-binding protein
MVAALCGDMNENSKLRRFSMSGLRLKLVALIAAAMTSVFAMGANAQESKLNVALTSDVPSLDPTLDLSLHGFSFRLNVYDQLTETLPDGAIGPRLATSWEPSDEARTWTLTIRTDAKFHDGSPVTVDDVVWTFEKILADSRSALRVYMSKVQEVEAIGDDQVKFTLSDSIGIFPRQLSFVSILPQKAFEEMGEEAFGQNPVGSGPYTLVERVSDDRIVLSAFEEYWRGAPQIKEVVMRPIPSPLARSSALLTGEIDIDPSVPPSLISRLEEAPDVNVWKADAFRVMYLGFNVDYNPALAEPDFRKAVDHAIDRDAIANQLLGGLGRPASQLASEITIGHDPEIEVTEFDPDKAHELLAGTSYAGEAIPFQYPSNNYALADDVAQAVAGYLGNAGINIDLQPMEFSAFLPLWSQRKLTGMFYFAYGSSIFDSSDITAGLYEEGSRIYEVNPEIDSLAKQARAETDEATREALYSRIFNISKESAAYVPLYEEVQSFATRENVVWEPQADGFYRFYRMSQSE